MIKHYLKISFRSIREGKTYAAINILGLSVAFSCILLIISFVHGELSYDDFHLNKTSVHRIVNDHTDNDTGDLNRVAFTYAPLAGLIDGNIKGVENVLRFHEKQGLMWIDGGEKSIEKNFLYADSTFFDLFDFELLRGDQQNPLDAPFSVVISQKLAEKYFGKDDPIGKVINNQDDHGSSQLVVTAVMENMPPNTHLEADVICSMSTLQKTQPWNFYWYYPPMYTYVQLSNGIEAEEVQTEITNFVQPKVPENFGTVDYQLQQLNEIYLHSNRQGEFRATGNYRTVMMFIIIAVIILVLATINFMNLATARSVRKAKEVGVRKVMGAHRKQLVFQFLVESVVTITLAFMISLGILAVAVDLFENVVDKKLYFGFIWSEVNLLIGAGALITISALAGLYPSLFLSAFQPVSVLKQDNPRQGPGHIRRILVVFQFTISCGLILATLVILQQMNFLRDKDLGFDKEHLLVIPLEETVDQENFELLKNLLKSHASVLNVSMTSGVPGAEGFYGFGYNIGTDPESISIATLGTDEDFVSTFDIKITEGRDFSAEITSDQDQSFLVNKAAVKHFGWEQPIGQELTLNYYIEGPITKKGQVIGVMEDFHYESLYNSIDPMIAHILPPSYYSQYVTVRLRPGPTVDAIDHFTDAWSKFNTSRPFDYFFLDDNLNRNYAGEIQLSKTFSWFAILAIVISCMGLIGLVTFSTEQRTKEIGIRKVLGASVRSILIMFSKEYLLLIVLANVIAWPLGWYYLSQWLNDFPYRITLEWYVFLATGAGILALAVGSVMVLANNAARRDPVVSLRYE